MNLFKKIKGEFFREVNRKVAVKATLMFGTMAAVYLFFIWSLLPVVFPEIQVIVLYISSCVIQLVALPLIMVGNSVLSEKAELRAQSDHLMIMEQFEIAKHMREEADIQRKQMLEMIKSAEEQRNELTKLNKEQCEMLIEIKSMHEDLHQILNKGKKVKSKK